MSEDNPVYTPPFSKAEYNRRLAETKKRMADAGFDLIICQDPANMNWLTGFDGWSFYTPQVVLVHLDAVSYTHLTLPTILLV